MYDFLIVGSGLYGATMAYLLNKHGYRVFVLERRNHIGGNIYTYTKNEIEVHRYGAHIFHTNNENVWKFVNQFSTFNRFTNSPIAWYKGEIYSLPFNMYTFNKIWNVVTPQDAQEELERQRKRFNIKEPRNLEEQAIALVGKDIYEILIKGYTEKQWGRKCTDLPSSIIKRLPVRFNYDNNYFNALYQGIPIAGYTDMIIKMLEGIDVALECDFIKNRSYYESKARKIIYTGPIDEYFNYKLGRLEYRTISFEDEYLNTDNYQGNAVVNYTDSSIPWTRIIEHKWFNFGKNRFNKDIHGTIISKEYSREWQPGSEPYYPVNNDINSYLYSQYRYLASKQTDTIFGGRLAEYKYYDMDQVVESAFAQFSKLVSI